MYHRLHAKSGFSLVQVSALITVAGLIMISVLPPTANDSEKIKITYQRMQKIEDATQAFMLKNMRRPCPARLDSKVVPDGAEVTQYNVELTAGDCTNSTVFYNNAIPIVVGAVPTKTLGLSSDYAVDGFGRRIMYAVDKRATTAKTCRDLQNQFDSSVSPVVKLYNKGSLQIADDSTSATVKDNVMWALMSYGKDGHGGIPANGAALTGRINTFSTDTETQFNSFDSGNDFTATEFGTDKGSSIYYGGRLVNKSHTSTFDDIVWYQETTKNSCCLGKYCTSGLLRMSAGGTALDSIAGGVGTSPASAALGMSVTTGDINGDGLPDLVIGQSTSSTNLGKISVVFGTKSGWPTGSGFNLSTDLNGTNGFTITNGCTSTHMSFFGRSVAVGDIDGDGYDDIVSNGGVRLAVVYGKSSFASAINLNTIRSDSPTAATSSGFFIQNGTVAAATASLPITLGDLNGDGIKDIIFSQGAATNLLTVIFGRTKTNWNTLATTAAVANCSSNTVSNYNFTGSAWTIANAVKIAGVTTTFCAASTASTTSGSNILTLVSPVPAYAVGLTVTGTGIQAATTINTYDAAARTLTMSKTATATGASIALTFSGVAATSYSIANSNYSLSAADVNNDGFEDLIVGGHSGTNGFVVFGRSTANTFGGPITPTATNPTWTTSVNSLTTGTQHTLCLYADNVGTFTAPVSGYYRTVRFTGPAGLGKFVTSGDITGDGIKDIIMAANQYTYVYNGKAFNSSQWQASSVALNTSAMTTIDTSTLPSWITASTLPMQVRAADINNDGKTDLMLSTSATTANATYGITANAGVTFAMMQPTTGWGTSGTPLTATLFGATDSQWFDSTTGLPRLSSYGFRIDGAATSEYDYILGSGDLNNDGRTDLIVGGTGGNSNAGYVYVVWGRSNVAWSNSTAEKLSNIY